MPARPRTIHLRIVSSLRQGREERSGRGEHPNGVVGLRRGERGRGESGTSRGERRSRRAPHACHGPGAQVRLSERTRTVVVHSPLAGHTGVRFVSPCGATVVSRGGSRTRTPSRASKRRSLPPARTPKRTSSGAPQRDPSREERETASEYVGTHQATPDQPSVCASKKEQVAPQGHQLLQLVSASLSLPP